LDFSSRFMSLFKGLDRAYGTYAIDGTTKYEGAKRVGKAITIRKDVTESLWTAHLSGECGLGIIPIRDDSHCFFGAIDIDVYPINLAELAQKIHALNLPILPCRSKSGGVHGYVFFSESVPASLLVPKLKDFAAALGYGGCETFPKQTQILAERGDMGNWINIPYYLAERTDRYGIKIDGSPMSPEEFLARAEDLKQTPALFKSIKVRGPDLEDGPPCLQYLIGQGFPAGTRNDGLMALCVYLRKSNPMGWKEEAAEYNNKYMDPPLSEGEVIGIVNSVDKKEYFYPCQKNPIKPHCNAAVCRKRRHGISQTTDTPTLGGLTKYNSNPPVWFVDIEGGGRMELSTEALQNQLQFQKRCMEVLHVMPPSLDKNVWMETVGKLLEKVHVIEVPEESTPQGQLIELLEQFCTSKAQGQTRDDILTGKPWLDQGLHHFKLKNFKDFLKRQNFRELEDHKITSVIQERGGQAHTTTIKGKFTRYWTFPEFATLKEPLAVPKFEQPKDPF
jgi:hypothetical protein